MKFEIQEWGAFPGVGNSWAANVDGRWCSFLQILKGGYRGNHIHPHDQYSVLLAGEVMIVKEMDGELVEVMLEKDKVHLTKAGVPHITIALEDAVGYEWWNGPFEAEPCPGLFDEYSKDRIGPKKKD